MKLKSFLFSLILIVPSCLFAQISLWECRKLAQQNYPLIKRYDLINRSEQFKISNISKNWLPQISINGQITYQSDVTALPISIPGITIEQQAKDQYKALISLEQIIWDGGSSSAQKKIEKSNRKIQNKATELELYQIYERINQLYFGVLLFNEQLQINLLLQEDLNRQKKIIESFIKNGIAASSDLEEIEIEVLKAQQQEVQLTEQRKTFVQMLSLFAGKDLDKITQWITPTFHLPNLKNNRPELQWFDAQESVLNHQEKLFNTQLRPHFGLIAQAGYGRPGLNLLNRNFDSFYYVGVKMNWNLSPLYTHKNNKLLLENQRKQIENKREVFLFNSNLQQTQEQGNIVTLRKQLKNDERIIELSKNITRSASHKVEKGTLTVTELLRFVNKENRARQTKAIHEIYLLEQLYKLKNTINQ